MFFFTIGIILLFSLSDDVGWEDSGELTAVTSGVAIAHPTGFPFYVIAAKAFQFFPISTIAWRSNFFSAVSAFSSIILLFFFIENITNKRGIGFLGILILIFTPHYLYQSRVAEIYSFSALGLTLLFFITGMYRNKFNESKQSFHSVSFLLLISFIIGLWVGVQPVFLLYSFPFLLSFFYFFKVSSSKKSQLTLLVIFSLSITLCFLGVSIYLFLPLRGKESEIIHWGPILNIKQFWEHISAADYRHGFSELSQFPGLRVLRERIGFLLFTLKGTSIIIFSPLSIIGFFSKENKFYFTLAFSVFLIDMLYVLFINPMGILTLQTSLVSLICMIILISIGIEQFFSYFVKI